jgi:hypothetical protein
MVYPQSLLVAASAALLSPGLAAGTSAELQSVLKNTHGSNEYGYPTDFTRGIMPVGSTLSYATYMAFPSQSQPKLIISRFQSILTSKSLNYVLPFLSVSLS